MIRRVHATTLGALANQEIPLEAVVEAIERDRAVETCGAGPGDDVAAEFLVAAVASSDHGLAFEEVDPGCYYP